MQNGEVISRGDLVTEVSELVNRWGGELWKSLARFQVGDALKSIGRHKLEIEFEEPKIHRYMEGWKGTCAYSS